MAINIANQRGSISNKALTGKRIGTNIKQISMKSRKNPKTNIISILVITVIKRLILYGLVELITVILMLGYALSVSTK